MWTIKMAVAAFALLAAQGALAQNAGNDALEKFGLAGTWAVDCSKPKSPSNPYQIYAPSDPNPTRTLRMEQPSLDDTFDMRNARLLDAKHLAYNDRRQGGADVNYDVVLEMSGGRLQSVKSIANDGTVMIRDGRFTKSGGPVPIFEKCTR